MVGVGWGRVGLGYIQREHLCYGKSMYRSAVNLKKIVLRRTYGKKAELNIQYGLGGKEKVGQEGLRRVEVEV